jgi:hypothetical protein
MSAFFSVRFASALLSLAAGCAALLLIGGDAQARVPAGRLDTASYACGQLQDRYDQLVAEYKRLGSSMTQADHDRIIGELRQIGQTWNGSCSKWFGSIAYRKVPVQGLGSVVTGGVGPTLATQSTGTNGGKNVVNAAKAQRSILTRKK